MPDMPTYKIGQRVSLTGEIVYVYEDGLNFDVRLDGAGDGRFNSISLAAMTHAKIVKEPEVQFTREQRDALREAFALKGTSHVVQLDVPTMIAWLDSHTKE
jgi:hypothetical protein